MRAVSQKFLDALKSGSQTVTSRVEFRIQGVKIANVEVLGGDTKDDKTASIRRTCSLTLDESSTPLPGRDYDDSPLWPVGNEVQVYSGFQYGDGTIEEVPQGLFRIAKPRIDHTVGDLAVTLEGYDRSRAMSRNRFTDVYIIPAGRDYSSEIKKLVKDRLPYMYDDDFDFMATDGSDGNEQYKTPRLVFAINDDPWVRATEMARSLGAELLFDGVGECILRPEPDPRFTPPSYYYVSGEFSLLEQVTRDLDDEEAYNGIIVLGQNTENSLFVPRGEAWDGDSTSPTYYNPAQPELSIYGAVPLILTSDYVTTDQQARIQASAELLVRSGVMESVEFGGITNPAQEGGDIIQIQDPESGVNGIYILDSLGKGLGPEGGMSGTTRKRRIQS